jgi:hypothetical protein
VLAALAVVGGAALVSGCTSLRNTLGTTNANCYVALPRATTAVGAAGRLQGVRLERVSSLRTASPALYRAATSTPGRPIGQVCLVAFTGHFSAASVQDPVGQKSGRVAVVEVEYPDNRLLATLVAARPPLHFGHSHIGVP